MKLISIRTNKEIKVLNYSEKVYTVQLANGTIKELAESTVKRWYRKVEEPAKTNRTEPQKVESNLVEKAKPPRKPKSVTNKDFKNKIALVLTEYVHSLDLKVEKRKEYIGAYTNSKKKVVEIRSTRCGVKISVRPMVFLAITDEERKKCFYLPEKANLHFRTTMEISSTNDLDLAKKLIKLSMEDLEG